jgi:hypothetical protein
MDKNIFSLGQTSPRREGRNWDIPMHTPEELYNSCRDQSNGSGNAMDRIDNAIEWFIIISLASIAAISMGLWIACLCQGEIV